MTLENLNFALYINNIEIMKRINGIINGINASDKETLDGIKNQMEEIHKRIEDANKAIEEHIKDNSVHVPHGVREIIEKLSVSGGSLMYDGKEINNIKKHISVIHGNGDRKTFPLRHGLNTDNISIHIRNQEGETCFADYSIQDKNNITLEFADAPQGTEIYTVTIL